MLLLFYAKNTKGPTTRLLHADQLAAICSDLDELLVRTLKEVGLPLLERVLVDQPGLLLEHVLVEPSGAPPTPRILKRQESRPPTVQVRVERDPLRDVSVDILANMMVLSGFPNGLPAIGAKVGREGHGEPSSAK